MISIFLASQEGECAETPVSVLVNSYIKAARVMRFANTCSVRAAIKCAISKERYYVKQDWLNIITKAEKWAAHRVSREEEPI